MPLPGLRATLAVGVAPVMRNEVDARSAIHSQSKVIDFGLFGATVGPRDLRNNRIIMTGAAMNDREHDVKHFIGQVETLRSRFEELVNPIDWDELIPIWDQPGWTTPAEYRLVAGSLDAMVRLTDHMVEVKKTLIEGSRLVNVRG